MRRWITTLALISACSGEPVVSESIVSTQCEPTLNEAPPCFAWLSDAIAASESECLYQVQLNNVRIECEESAGVRVIYIHPGEYREDCEEGE
jgi:hypothetical protein